MTNLITSEARRRLPSRLPWQRTIVGDVTRFPASEARTCHHHHIRPFLYHLGDPLRKLHHDVSEVDERKWRRNLICSNQIRQFLVGNPVNHRFHQLCTVESNSTCGRAVSLVKRFLYALKKTDDGLLPGLLQASPQLVLRYDGVVHRVVDRPQCLHQ